MRENKVNDSLNVLFLCTENSARSQMAEGLLRRLGGPHYRVYSAGTDPKPVHPLAIKVMQDAGINISGYRSKSLDEFRSRAFDYLITACDKARDNCPTFPGDSEKIHWGFEDPAAVRGDGLQRLCAFRRTMQEIGERIRVWTALHDAPRRANLAKSYLNDITFILPT